MFMFLFMPMGLFFSFFFPLQENSFLLFDNKRDTSTHTEREDSVGRRFLFSWVLKWKSMSRTRNRRGSNGGRSENLFCVLCAVFLTLVEGF
uniref:Importin-9 isoform X1 n=1 Tax=Rhizophora mucronata TaxID=61149 RepID=A0A2P2M7P7_RHIMU